MEGNFYEFLEENSLNYQTNSISRNQGNLDSEEKYSDSSCNKTGHWSKEEHHKFLEGMFLFGNDWKSVQNHIGTRSSTQARSHAQKFFQRMKKKLRWESCTSKNISKEFLFNLFKDSSPNKDIGEENKAKLMKIIGSFTDPPLKRSKKFKRVSEEIGNSLSSSEEKIKKTYFDIRKVHKENHNCNKKSKESNLDESFYIKENPKVYCDQNISQISSNYLNYIQDNQNNILSLIPVNQQSLDKFKTGYIVFPSNSDNNTQKKINLLNFPPNKNHLEVPILNSKGKCLQKSTSLLQFLLDCKKQGANSNTNLYKRSMSLDENEKIIDKPTDTSTLIMPQENLGTNNSPSVVNVIYDENQGILKDLIEEKQEEAEHNPFNTNFEGLKEKKKSDEDIQNYYEDNNNLNYENCGIFSNLKYD